MITDANRVEPGARIKTDVCVIGSGAAGITLALELSRNNIATVLLTGGQKRERSRDRELYRGETESAHPHEPLEEGRRRAFGGTTLAWGGGCIPFDPIDFEGRPWIPDSGWPVTYEDLLPHYKRAMDFCQAGSYSFDAAETFSAEQASMVQCFDGPKIVSTGLVRFSLPTNFAKEYAAELRRARGLQVLIGGHAVHIQVKPGGKSIEHIRTAAEPGREFFVDARLYVLAAGGLENPRLLLSSSDVHTSGIGNSTGLVGRYYMSHLKGENLKINITDRGAPFRYQLERDRSSVYCQRRFTLTPLAQTQLEIGNAMATPHRPPISDPSHGDPLFSTVFLAKQYENAWRNGGLHGFPARLRENAELHGQHWQVIRGGATPSTVVALSKIFRTRYLAKRHLPMVLPSREVRDQYLRYQTEHAPNRNSRVTLSGQRDSFGLPRLTVHPDFSEVDYRTVIELQQVIAERLDVTQTGRFVFDEAVVREQISHHIKHFNSGAHHLGTTRMSASQANGIVDANCKVHDVDDLFIAGGSVFATSGAANPTLTIVALAVRLAAHLRQELAEGAVAITSSTR